MVGPKATGGGFNDRADVQCTCRGMLGDGLKKHSSSLWPGKAAQGQLCSRGRLREPDTCLQQKAGDQSARVNNKIFYQQVSLTYYVSSKNRSADPFSD